MRAVAERTRFVCLHQVHGAPAIAAACATLLLSYHAVAAISAKATTAVAASHTDLRPAAGSACGYLVRQSDASLGQQNPTAAPATAGAGWRDRGGHAAFIASYPTVDAGPLHAAAFLYDNAVAAIALVGCGESVRARRIGDALLSALDRDRYWHDGRLRNGYAAGPVGEGALKLAGWWDRRQNRWLEDSYQASSDSGNLAWAMLALLALDRGVAQSPYRAGALRIAGWLAKLHDARGAGGYLGGVFGHEPMPLPLRWKSTEHNTDLAAAFEALAFASGDARWRAEARAARGFVVAMWDARCGCFAAGTGEDGVTRNPLLALDAQIWPLLALPGAATRHAGALASVQARLRRDAGYAYSEAGTSLWTEGTAQVALLLELSGRSQETSGLRAAIAAQRAVDGGYYASAAPQTPTGFMLSTDPTQPRRYFHVAHLGAAAWVALFEQRFNPFTATAALAAQ